MDLFDIFKKKTVPLEPTVKEQLHIQEEKRKAAYKTN
jgi:hypothetical protein